MQMNAVGQLGLGAGIFGGGGVLGQTDASAPAYPWHEYDDGTLSIQIAHNLDLMQLEMPLVTEDGVLGAETCGALSYLAGEGYQGAAKDLNLADCQSFAYPPSSAPTSPPPSAPPTTETPTVSKAGAGGGMSSIGWLLIAGGVATAGVYLATRKRR